MTENWLPVVGYEGLYEVSDLGGCQSLDRYVRCGRGKRLVPGQPMALMPLNNGHLCVQLSNGSNRKFLLHRLVLEAFVGPCPDGMEGCHWDDDPTNNRLSNLRWDTHTANLMDIIRNGNHVNANKTRCPQGHLLISSPWEPGRRYCRDCRKDVSRRYRQKSLVRS